MWGRLALDHIHVGEDMHHDGMIKRMNDIKRGRWRGHKHLAILEIANRRLFGYPTDHWMVSESLDAMAARF